jgi:hypothetical protein
LAAASWDSSAWAAALVGSFASLVGS